MQTTLTAEDIQARVAECDKQAESVVTQANMTLARIQGQKEAYEWLLAQIAPPPAADPADQADQADQANQADPLAIPPGGSIADLDDRIARANAPLVMSEAEGMDVFEANVTRTLAMDTVEPGPADQGQEAPYA